MACRERQSHVSIMCILHHGMVVYGLGNIRTDMGGYCQLNSHCPGITGLSGPIMNCVVYLTAALWSVSTQKVVGLNPTGHALLIFL